MCFSCGAKSNFFLLKKGQLLALPDVDTLHAHAEHDCAAHAEAAQAHVMHAHAIHRKFYM
jgi:hypothetical protein